MVVSLEKLHRSQGGVCCYCGGGMRLGKGRGNSVTRDHREPKSMGGGAGRMNISGACRRCNQLKDMLTAAEFLAAFPTAEAIERALPMARFDAQVKTAQSKSAASRRWPPRLASDQVRPDQAWEAMKARLGAPVRPLPPPRCGTCRWFGPLDGGSGPICLLRWMSLPWGRTPFVEGGDGCEEWAR